MKRVLVVSGFKQTKYVSSYSSHPSLYLQVTKLYI